MTITANIFAYDGDEPLLSYCVRALSRANHNIWINVIDDHHHPISQSGIMEIAGISDKVSYRRSSWDRGGNLNGTAATLGILREMQASCDGRDGASIKVDCDTMVINAKWIDTCIERDIKMCCVLRPPVVPSGICYLLSNEWLPKLERAIQSLELPNNCAEDVTILSVMQAIGHRENLCTLLPQSEENKKGRWTGWDYNLDPQWLKLVAEKIEVISLGNWKFFDGLTSKDAAKIASILWEHLINNKEKP